MRGIFFLVMGVIVLSGAGVISISWSDDGSATVKFNKEKARERGQQVLEEARTIEDSFLHGSDKPK